MKASELREQAKQYARMAVVDLSLVNPKRQHELEDEYDRLKFHFMFPNVSEAELCDLLALLCARKALQITLRHQDPAALLTDDQAARIDGREKIFMKFKTHIQDKILPRLTAVQRQVVEEDLFSIHFRP